MKNLFYIFIRFVVLILFSNQLSAAPACRILINGVETNQQIVRLTEQEVRDLVDNSKSYQDKRNKEWTDRNRCLCCHTTLPYMLARTYDQNSKQVMEKIKDMAALKVEDPNAAPWYPADHAGKNSKPTEAVVHAITLLMYDMATQSGIKPVTLKAVDQIFEHMNISGRIHWLDFALQPFESKKGELWGNSMAVLAVELAQKNSNYRAPVEKYAKLKSFVLGNVTKLKPQEMAVLLWANSNSGVEKVLTPSQYNLFVSKIIETQNDNGSWNQKTVLGQGKNSENIYATAISLIGLIKSGQGNIPAIHKAAKWLAAQQQSGQFLGLNESMTFWTSLSMNRVDVQRNDRFASDVATSYSSLALQLYAREVLSLP